MFLLVDNLKTEIIPKDGWIYTKLYQRMDMDGFTHTHTCFSLVPEKNLRLFTEI